MTIQSKKSVTTLYRITGHDKINGKEQEGFALHIRFAAIDDSAALLDIYAQYIHTPTTFEYELPTRQEFAGRIRDISGEYPYLVCEEKGKIIGYAYAHRQKERKAYQWNAELSIYLDPASTSRGIGKKLYGALIEILKLQGIHTAYGVVTIPNEKSERLHASMGFRRIGEYHKTGYKCGAWHDVACFEKEIVPYSPEPRPIIPICRIPKEKLEPLLQIP